MASARKDLPVPGRPDRRMSAGLLSGRAGPVQPKRWRSSSTSWRRVSAAGRFTFTRHPAQEPERAADVIGALGGELVRGGELVVVAFDARVSVECGERVMQELTRVLESAHAFFG